MKTFLFTLLILFVVACNSSIEDTELIPNNPQLIALDSIAEYYENEGWTSDAAYLIAGFEVDLYDESDTAEYRLYVAYMED